MLQYFSNLSGVMEAVNHSKNSAMEAENHVKHGASSKILMSRKNLRYALLISFSITSVSLFGQVVDRKEISTEMISNISEIVECDAKMLGLIFSIGFETINNYVEASSELDKTQNLVDYFSYRAKKSAFWIEVTPDELAKFNLNMTVDELVKEMLKHIGGLSRKDISGGRLNNRHAKKLSDVYIQEVENLKPEYSKAEKALLENEKIIMLIPPDYRYPLALSTMYGLVKNFRATTWKECADLYEEQYHRWVMEENSKESVRIQSEIRNLTGQMATHTKSIAKSSRATAIFTGLMYLGL